MEFRRARHEDLIYTDCLLRNIHRFEFVVPIDTDEVILPSKGKTLKELMAGLDKGKGTLEEADYFAFSPHYFLDKIKRR